MNDRKYFNVILSENELVHLFYVESKEELEYLLFGQGREYSFGYRKEQWDLVGLFSVPGVYGISVEWSHDSKDTLTLYTYEYIVAELNRRRDALNKTIDLVQDAETIKNLKDTSVARRKKIIEQEEIERKRVETERKKRFELYERLRAEFERKP